MAFLVIPNEVYANDATIWVAAINENFNQATTVLGYGTDQVALHSGWVPFATGNGQNRMVYQRVPLHNLTQATRYQLTLRVGGQIKADGSFKTIPWRLPVAGEQPFIALLGSCFSAREDSVGAVGQTYMQLPRAASPGIKILCGDQVYLDSPFQDFFNPLKGHDWLENRSFKTYSETWTQDTGIGGFGQMLKHGANFFSSDDHEYWNNAPDVGLTVPLFTSTSAKREKWWNMAHDLYKAFQTSPGLPVTFKIDPVSFCIAETRFSRGSGRGGSGDCMRSVDLDAIGNWTANLDGPGVLVVGQPFFAARGDVKDYNLPDFQNQYRRLGEHLRNSKHSIVILTGDVHFGRIGFVKLRPELGTSLYEVISSPMQLVPKSDGSYSPLPDVFGSPTSEPDYSQGRNHFLTLEFTAPSSRRASLVIRFWPIQTGAPPQSQIVSGTQPIELF